MNKSIQTYDDLLREKQQLEVLLHAQKELIVYDINELKAQLKPTADAFSFIGKLTTRESGNILLTGTANKLIDLIFRRLILSKAGWLTKLAVPFFLKNYSSHLIHDNKDKILNKIFSLFKKKSSANGKADNHEE